MMQLKAPYEVYNLSLIQFSRNSIDPLKLYLWVGRWYNILLLIKLLIFEVNFVTLQIMPRTQSMLILFIQFLFLVMTLYAAIKDKIFQNKFTSVLACANETFIFSFTMLCVWISFGGSLKIPGW